MPIFFFFNYLFAGVQLTGWRWATLQNLLDADLPRSTPYGKYPGTMQVGTNGYLKIRMSTPSSRGRSAVTRSILTPVLDMAHSSTYCVVYADM